MPFLKNILVEAGTGRNGEDWLIAIHGMEKWNGIKQMQINVVCL